MKAEDFLELKGWSKDNLTMGGVLFMGIAELLEEYASQQCQKRDEIIKVQDELVEWLNQECPAVVPPLEPYNNYDLTHTFCDSLRMRLDKIEQLKSEISNENRKSS